MISICMAYFNRKRQLIKSLESISKSAIKDFEIIIVDDGSDDFNTLAIKEIPEILQSKTIIIKINKNKKTWYNSCIAYNIAFSAASGDIIIIQNPEIFHFGDVLLTASNVTDKEYFTFHTLALNETDTNMFYEKITDDEITNFIKPIISNTTHIIPGHNPYDGQTIWYNHKNFRPNHYHFLSAITKNNLYKLGGFDERYQNDHSWDDNEFLARIDRLNLNKIFIEWPVGIHLYHPRFYTSSPYDGQYNYNLYHKTTLSEKSIKIQTLDFNNYKKLII